MYKNNEYQINTPRHLYLFDADCGPAPFVADINKSAGYNGSFRSALWTGKHLQVTLMTIPAGKDIGLEIHPDLDQLLHITEGQCLVRMGNRKDNLNFRQPAFNEHIIIIPAGTWHNVINTGSMPLKLYSVYAPPAHPWGTVHPTKEIAEAAEMHNY